MSTEKSCLRSHGALIIADNNNELVNKTSKIQENPCVIESTTQSVGTADETIVRRGDGKSGRRKENTLKSDDVGRQTSDLRLTFPSQSKINEPVQEEEVTFCCCRRKKNPMIWL